ncbi:ABC transporter ATP-binding protein/permease [Corallococcus llansteffanensis]|uniref:ABC transporter ATP-binding protein/permease n=1 Tax=Corallococcus llansteffanensis TaxID=2316731 RepID=UPI001ABFB030|nr:ATP-binding cassette domain-containing protein [Corallococcus llansteffanensis]
MTRTFQGEGRDKRKIVANDALSFEVRRGEVFGLLGPNGAGKTTLVSQLLGLLQPSSGRIFVEGIDVTRRPQLVKELVGFLPQTRLGLRFVEVEQALIYVGRLRGQTEADARRQARELLEELGLTECSRQYVYQLSGGQTRIVNFAMALMGWPPVLLLDEPTNELDPHKRRQVWDVIARLNREHGTTCILVTHNVLEAEKVIRRVAVMQSGRIIALGTPGELKARLGARVRLELQLRDGEGLAPENHLKLAAMGDLEQPHPGRYRLYLPTLQVALATDLVVNQLGLAQLDDFRLAPPSLEDVYLELKDEGVPKPTALPLVVEPGPVAPAVELVPAAPPGLRPRPGEPRLTGGRKFLVDIKYLWLEQMGEVRKSWPLFLVFSLFMPLAMIFGLARVGRGLNDRESLLYIISGASIFAVVIEGVVTMAQRVGIMKRDGLLLYYASLPISKAAFVISLMLSRLSVTLPGMIIPLIAGPALYDVELHFSPWVLVLMPLTILSLASLGVTLGTAIKSVDLIVMVTNALVFVLLMAAPVFIPEAALPVPLRMLGYAIPPTYAADALRHALGGTIGPRFYLDIAVLSVMAAGGLWAMSRWLRWYVK